MSANITIIIIIIIIIIINANANDRAGVCVCVTLYTAPAPNNVQPLTSNHCQDHKHNPNDWFYTRPSGGNCDRIPSLEDLFDVDEHKKKKEVITADDIVFVFQFPNPRDGHELSMSRLHQTMLSVFTLTIQFDESYSDGKHHVLHVCHVFSELCRGFLFPLFACVTPSAMLKHVLAIGWTSVCLSVTPRYCVKRLNLLSNCLHGLVAP